MGGINELSWRAEPAAAVFWNYGIGARTGPLMWTHLLLAALIRKYVASLLQLHGMSPSMFIV
jgi:hypothetical protein